MVQVMICCLINTKPLCEPMLMYHPMGSSHMIKFYWTSEGVKLQLIELWICFSKKQTFSLGRSEIIFQAFVKKHLIHTHTDWGPPTSFPQALFHHDEKETSRVFSYQNLWATSRYAM